MLCNKPLVSDQISQEADSNESDNNPLEEWHAPAGFSLDSKNSTLKKKRMSYEELEKSLYEVLESNTELIELNKKLRAYRNESDIEMVCRLQTTLEKTKID